MLAVTAAVSVTVNAVVVTDHPRFVIPDPFCCTMQTGVVVHACENVNVPIVPAAGVVPAVKAILNAELLPDTEVPVGDVPAPVPHDAEGVPTEYCAAVAVAATAVLGK